MDLIRLPQDLLSHYIETALTPKELLQLSLTCKFFREVRPKKLTICGHKLGRFPALCEELEFLEFVIRAELQFGVPTFHHCPPLRSLVALILSENYYTENIIAKIPRIRFFRSEWQGPHIIFEKYQDSLEYVDTTLLDETDWKDLDQCSQIRYLSLLMDITGTPRLLKLPYLSQLRLLNIVFASDAEDVESESWGPVLHHCQNLRGLIVNQSDYIVPRVIIPELLDPEVCPRLMALHLTGRTTPGIRASIPTIEARSSLRVLVILDQTCPVKRKRLLTETKYIRYFDFSGKIAVRFVYVGGEKIVRPDIQLQTEHGDKILDLAI